MSRAAKTRAPDVVTADVAPDATSGSRPAATAPQVLVCDLQKSYRARGETVAAVDGVSVAVEPSEILVLLGPSGCGKTTLLRSIAGLETPDAGDIWIEGRHVYSDTARINLAPEHRGVSFVFQSYALWPHMTVLKNVMYPLRAEGVDRRAAAGRAAEALGVVNCEHLVDRYPGELSGGQQQRVALARAIVSRRGLIFFDEPLSNIDAKVREKLRIELLNIRDAVGFAGMYVTHDQDEAMILGDRIAVMNNGKILQIGPPREIYDEPANRWVADFIGSANFVEGEVAGLEGSEVVVSTPLGTIRAAAPEAADAARAGVRGSVFFRPAAAELRDTPTGGANCWPCEVKHTISVADRVDVVVEADGRELVVSGTRGFESGVRAWMCVAADRARFFVE